MTIHPLRPREHEDAARVAIDWLAERHRKGWRAAVESLLDAWRPEGPDDGWQLDEDGMTMVSVNAGEWLIARGEINARGGLREINAYLLSRDGPFLTPGQQAWIAQLRARPLRLYRITDVQPGAGMTLVDELDPQAQPTQVREISGSRGAKPGMLMGARLMLVAAEAGSGEPEHWELSGAVYPFSKLGETSALNRIRGVAAGAAAFKLQVDNQRDLLEMEIAQAWLEQWFAPAPLPQLVDASTGEPLLFVTDHYRVTDASALATALAAQADVEGDAHEGWHRVTDSRDGMRRSLTTVNPGRAPDRIEVLHRIQRQADEGRAWFESLAGPAVHHLTREITDPRSSLGKAGKGGTATARTAGTASEPALPPELMSQAMEQFIRSHYAHWCDEPIPALNGLTPRAAIGTPGGMERVKGLLRQYEDGERSQAAAQRRPAVSYQFLWDALGIER